MNPGLHPLSWRGSFGARIAVDKRKECIYILYSYRRIHRFDWDEHNIRHIAERRVDADEVEEAFELHGATARPVTARDMTAAEKRLYRGKGA